MKTIVVATDGSDASQLAVREGLEIARDAGAAVTVMTARGRIASLGAPHDIRELSRQLLRTRATLERARAEAEGLGVDVAYATREGDAAEAIIRLADDRNADLVVVGSRGLGRIRGALLGSVSQKVVRKAGRPVLVVK
jgi:nucleotide-binding universal stress UspA family protein